MNLDISHLTFAYAAGDVVLDDLSMSVATGSTVAVVGPSGCGKTTLLRLIAGILNRQNHNDLRGRVLWDGVADTEEFRRRGKIGYMFQTPTLLPHLSVAKNVVFPFISGSIERPKAMDAAGLLEQVGLSKYADYHPDQLSVGMRARVALARTFSTNPTLLLLDEPFSSLDIGWRLALYNQLWLEAKVSRPTIVLVTHDVSEAFLLASRVFVMNRNGKIASQIESQEQKPETASLDGTRAFFLRIADVVEQTQYQISQDIVAATEASLQ